MLEQVIAAMVSLSSSIVKYRRVLSSIIEYRRISLSIVEYRRVSSCLQPYSQSLLMYWKLKKDYLVNGSNVKVYSSSNGGGDKAADYV